MTLLTAASRYGHEGALAALGGALNLGVLVLDGARGLVYANAAACDLLACADIDHLAAEWPTLQALLCAEARAPLCPQGRPRWRRLELRVGSAVRQLQQEIQALDGDGHAGWLMLLKNPQLVDARDYGLLLASRLHSEAYLGGSPSHDLTTPLNSMQITLELLDASCSDASIAPDATARQRRYFEVLRQDIARLAHGLHAFADRNLPLPQAQARDFDLRAVAQAVADRVQVSQRGRGVSLRLQLPDNAIAIRAHGGAAWLELALLAIAVYCLRTAPGDGVLLLRLACARREYGALISVADAGPALSKQTLEDISQLLRTPDAEAPTLGLYAARLAVEVLGGELRIDATRKRGRRFCCLLPRSEP